eukprot:TRINITY_DN24298_c0_g1_i1.p1 TRINITY_DN24298_c0_g1~~TRINITY_DN24298_c0_g1_i1.p1  ORF type:complete len:301 (+),score=97.48 TRINITY_DN24298_c0_g1_i1:109-1011(+)
MVDMEDGRKSLLKSDAAAADARSGSMLQEYATEFDRLHNRATMRLQALREAKSASWADDAKAAEAVIQEMESNRRQVQVQLRLELSSATDKELRQTWDGRVQDWTQITQRLRTTLDTAKAERSRMSLLGGTSDAEAALAMAQNSAQRQGAMQSTELLSDSSRKLEEAKRQAMETEAVGQGVLSDLAAQGEQIRNMRDNMRTIGDELNSARKSLDRLIRGAQQNRLVTLVVAALLSTGLMVWALTVVGLPMQWNCVLSVLLVAIFYAAHRLKAKLASAREVDTSEGSYINISMRNMGASAV